MLFYSVPLLFTVFHNSCILSPSLSTFTRPAPNWRCSSVATATVICGGGCRLNTGIPCLGFRSASFKPLRLREGNSVFYFCPRLQSRQRKEMNRSRSDRSLGAMDEKTHKRLKTVENSESSANEEVFYCV